MGLLVCRCESGTVDWRAKLAYLDQAFYEYIHRLCRREGQTGVLARIAALGYGDEMTIPADRLPELATELAQLEPSDARVGEELARFRAVVELVIDHGSELGVAGDMYPVLP
jgi:hypothetical protein